MTSFYSNLETALKSVLFILKIPNSNQVMAEENLNETMSTLAIACSLSEFHAVILV